MEPASTAKEIKTSLKTAWSVLIKILARSVLTNTSRSTSKALVSAEEEESRSSIQPPTRISAFVKMNITQPPKAAWNVKRPSRCAHNAKRQPRHHKFCSEISNKTLNLMTVTWSVRFVHLVTLWTLWIKKVIQLVCVQHVMSNSISVSVVLRMARSVIPASRVTSLTALANLWPVNPAVTT